MLSRAEAWLQRLVPVPAAVATVRVIGARCTGIAGITGGRAFVPPRAVVAVGCWLEIVGSRGAAVLAQREPCRAVNARANEREMCERSVSGSERGSDTRRTEEPQIHSERG